MAQFVPQAAFRNGEPVIAAQIAGTPSAGDVLAVSGDLPTEVVHRPTSNGNASLGLGVYEIKNLDNSPNYKRVYWDATNQGVTSTSTGNSFFGYIASRGGGGANSLCWALHFPFTAASTAPLPLPTEGDIVDQPSGQLVFVFDRIISAAAVPLTAITVLGVHPTTISQFAPNQITCVTSGGAWNGIPAATPWAITAVAGVCQAGSGTLGM
jgi:hypothetical protein